MMPEYATFWTPKNWRAAVATPCIHAARCPVRHPCTTSAPLFLDAALSPMAFLLLFGRSHAADDATQDHDLRDRSGSVPQRIVAILACPRRGTAGIARRSHRATLAIGSV